MNPIAKAIDVLQGDGHPYGMLYVVIGCVKKKLNGFSEEYRNSNLYPLVTLLQQELTVR